MRYLDLPKGTHDGVEGSRHCKVNMYVYMYICMYVCMCILVCMCPCKWCMWNHIWNETFSYTVHGCLCVCHLCACMNARASIFNDTQTHSFIYIHVYIHIYLHVRTHACLHHTRNDIHAHIHIYTQIHIHTLGALNVGEGPPDPLTTIFSFHPTQPTSFGNFFLPQICVSLSLSARLEHAFNVCVRSYKYTRTPASFCSWLFVWIMPDSQRIKEPMRQWDAQTIFVLLTFTRDACPRSGPRNGQESITPMLCTSYSKTVQTPLSGCYDKMISLLISCSLENRVTVRRLVSRRMTQICWYKVSLTASLVLHDETTNEMCAVWLSPGWEHKRIYGLCRDGVCM